MSQESYVCCTTMMYDVQNRCFPYKIDFFYFKTFIITHDIDVTEQNINVSTLDILCIKKKTSYNHKKQYIFEGFVTWAIILCFILYLYNYHNYPHFCSRFASGHRPLQISTFTRICLTCRNRGQQLFCHSMFTQVKVPFCW